MKKIIFNQISKSLKRSSPMILGLWLILFIPVILFAEHLPIKIYTSADGLGSSFVDYLLRDSRGFMWFCTRGGLSRFDGSKFTTFKFGGDNSPPGIENIIETRDGSFWVMTIGGLYRFKPDTVAKSNPSENGEATINAELVHNERGLLLEDHLGNLWLGSDGFYSVTEHDGKLELKQTKLNLPAPPGRSFGMNEFFEAPDGSLWMDSNWGVVRRLPDGRVIFYPHEVSVRQDFHSMILDADGRIWVSRGLDLFIFKPESIETLADLGQITIRPLKPTRILPSDIEKEIQLPETPGDMLQMTNGDFLKINSSKKLFQTSDRHIWLTTQKELIEFDGRVFHLYGTAQGLPLNMTRMAEDSSGNLWIGGQTGLLRLDRRGLKTFSEADGLHANNIFAINEDSQGTLYFANGDFYISHLTGKNFQTVRPQIPPDSVPLWTSRYAFLSSQNEWWILTKNKLFRFSAANLSKPLRVYSTADGLKSNEIYQIFEDSKGDIWVSVQPLDRDNLGLARYDRAADKFHSFSQAENFPSGKSVSAFAQDRYGNLWLAFYEGGIARYANGRFQVFGETAGLPRSLITDLHIDRNGRLWLSSALRGLMRIDNLQAETPEINYFTTEQGLSSNNIRTITEDGFGNIYVGTVRGVDRISPEPWRVKHYSIADGLASDFVVDSHCDKSGTLWFATTNGLSKLVPTQNENASPPKIWLGGLYIAGVEQSISALGDTQFGNIELEHTQNNLQIDFFALDFRAGETLRYQYKLEGADSDWSAPSEQRSVTFANLQPATYRFLVRAVNSDGVASENPAVVSFKILPPVWARWWFITICCLVAFGILFALERYRAARVRELKTAFGELSVSENRFRNLVEQSPLGIIVLAPDGKIRATNQAYLEMWGAGTTYEQILNWDLQTDEQLIRGGVVEGLGRAFAGEFVKFEPVLFNLRPNGNGEPQTVWVGAVAYPVKDDDGNLREVICILENITARKTAEERLERSRLERLVELERVRSRIATDLHDDIGASLTQIAVLSEVAQAQGKNGNGASAEPLSRISDVSNQLVEAMSDIVWSINPAKDHLSDLTQRMRRFASDVFSARGIGFHFTAPDAEQEITVGTNLRREVFLIFKESINNIVKHSAARKVEIDLKIADGNLILKISDDGQGFAAETNGASLSSNYGGNGILSMKKRALEMNGKVEIKSETGNGTTVNLNLPIEQALQK